jgi:hypothetical protein
MATTKPTKAFIFIDMQPKFGVGLYVLLSGAKLLAKDYLL